MKCLIGIIFCSILSILSVNISKGQVCTISGSGTISWDNSSPPACNEGGDADDPGVTTLIIPSAVDLDFDSNGDTWTGTDIEVNGSLNISFSGQIDIFSNIIVKNGGSLAIASKLSLDCGNTVSIESGGVMDIVSGSGGSDRLSICGTIIAQGGGGCNPNYPDGSTPYCEPSGGFTGPVDFDEGGVVLPVELLYFKANADDNSVSLSWKTATELNNDYFTLEKSKDGINYSTIGTVAGYGTTNDPKKYEFTDKSPVFGLSYYRLQQTDYDGTTEIFRPVSVYFEGEGNNIILYPNPVVNNDLYISLSNFQDNSDLTIEISDITGKTVLATLLKTNEFGAVDDKVSLAGMPKGSYLVKLLSGTTSSVFKIIKN